MKSPTRTYGQLQFVKKETSDPRHWGKPGYYFHMTKVVPHVCIKLKSVFEKLDKSQLDDFYFPFKDDVCNDLRWFLDRYPMEMHGTSENKIKSGHKRYVKAQAQIETILSDGYTPPPVLIKHPWQPRPYQSKGAEMFLFTHKMLLLDELGLGKSLTAVLPAVINPRKTLPMLIVCQTHLPLQWKQGTIEKFTNLSCFIIPVGLDPENKNIPNVDVIICPYSRLAKWGSILMHRVKYIVFDEVQELRRKGTEDKLSQKYSTSKNLCEQVDYVMGLSGSPIYNYAIEMHNILNCIKDGCVGSYYDWGREWGWNTVRDPKALGSYLREVNLILRRTDKEVGRELPALNTIVTTVEYDESEIERENEIAKQLAMSYLTSSSFMEKGSAAMELDARLRQTTGIAKAKSVAALVKILLENDKPVLLSGWHRAVYDIWLTELMKYKPVMYTGTETVKEKEEAKRKFVSGESKVMIISNRSGAGLDELQYSGCHDVVIGELDWSPQVHRQIIGRVRRDGIDDHVTVYYPVCDYGSDEPMIEVLGLKLEQQEAIVDPESDPVQQYSNEERIKLMAKNFLLKQGIDPEKLAVVVKPDGDLGIEQNNNAA